MKSIKIELNKTDYTVKLSNRAIIEWETLNNKAFAELTNRLDEIYSLMYCCLDANNEHFEYKYTEFLDLMDDNIQEFTKFVKYFEKLSGVNDDDKKKLKTDKLLNKLMKQ